MVLSNIHFTLVEKESSKVQFNEWDELSPLVEVPVQSYEWESYHSSLNQAGRILFPNTEICQSLNLKKLSLHLGCKPRNCDLDLVYFRNTSCLASKAFRSAKSY